MQLLVLQKWVSLTWIELSERVKVSDLCNDALISLS